MMPACRCPFKGACTFFPMLFFPSIISELQEIQKFLPLLAQGESVSELGHREACTEPAERCRAQVWATLATVPKGYWHRLGEYGSPFHKLQRDSDKRQESFCQTGEGRYIQKKNEKSINLQGLGKEHQRRVNELLQDGRRERRSEKKNQSRRNHTPEHSWRGLWQRREKMDLGASDRLRIRNTV